MSTTASPIRIRRGGRRWGAALVVVAALAWFAPALVALTPLGAHFVRAALSKHQGSVELKSLSLGWLSPVEVRGLELADPAGGALARIEQVRIERPLWQLLRNQSALGTVRLRGLEAWVVVYEGGSNLEAALAPFLAPSDPPAEMPDGEILVEQGVIHLRVAEDERLWEAQQVQARITPPRGDRPLAAEVEALLTDGAGPPGTARIELVLRPPAAGAASDALGVVEVTSQLERVPLSLANAARRMGLDVRAEGRLSASGKAVADLDRAGFAVELASLDLVGVRAAAPDWLGEAPLVLERLQGAGRIEGDRQRIVASGLRLESPVGALRGDGAFSLAALAAGHFAEALPQEDASWEGAVDLAALSQAAPGVVRLKDGVRITSGQATFRADSRLHEGRRRWTAEIDASPLAAIAEGRQIVWDQPVALSLAASAAGGNLAVERLVCQAPFLEFAAQGSLDQGSLAGTGDLAALAAQLDQVFDLRGLRLAGRIEAKGQWRREPDGRFAADASALLENIEAGLPDQPTWREPRLAIKGQLAGLADAAALKELRTAWAELESGEDRVRLELARPAPLATRDWPLRIAAKGDLDTWLARLSPWVSVAPWSVRGAFEAVAEATVSAEQAVVESLQAKGRQIQAIGPSLAIVEPQVELQGAGQWTSARGELSIAAATLAATSVSARLDQGVFYLGGPSSPKATPLAGDGRLSFRADLSRLSRWLAPQGQPPPLRLAGQATGEARFRHDGQAAECEWKADVEKFIYSVAVPEAPLSLSRGAHAARPVSHAVAEQTLWQEDRLALQGKARHLAADDALEIEQMRVVCESLALAYRGRVERLSTRPLLNLSGEAGYDLERISARLAPLWGQGIKLVGRGSRPFSVQGPLPLSSAAGSGGQRAALVAPAPLFDDAFTGQASFDWQSAELYGVAVGPGEAKIRLAQGIAEVEPLDLPVSGGRLRLAPRVYLNASPMLLVLGNGRMADSLEITDAMCRTWLKYLAPLAADATQASGKVSLDLEGATIPLTAPALGNAQGRLVIHQARLGPGPMAQQAMWLIEQARAVAEKRPPAAPSGADKTWMDLSEQAMPFQMAQGRVHHQDLRLRFGEVAVASQGSVGIDQTLDVNLAIAIPDSWIARQPALSGLRGKTLQAPLSGTLTQPKLDSGALRSLATQSMRGAAESLLEQGLQRLLPPRQP